jgi:uncharacterized protein YndB with AHSA1/START domain
MSEEKNISNEKSEGEIIITRIFDAPRELVWKAWTEPEHIKHWWGPKDYTAPYCSIDFRVGGVYLFCMRSPEGRDFWSTGIFREIVSLERIVCTHCFADEKGNIVPASHYGMSMDFPLEMLWTITFQENNGETRFSLRYSGTPSGNINDMANKGWNQSLDKFADTLKYSLPRKSNS